jgi:hypothetical protein
MKKKLKRKKDPAAIERLAELLRGVLDAFGWYGIGGSAVEEPAAHAPGLEPEAEAQAEASKGDADEEEEEEEEEYGERQYYFDPEDVQGAVDEAISTLIKERLIEEFDNPKSAPALSEIFSVLFGENSGLREQAEYFEELISGYDDKAHVDDLKEAYSILESIVEEIESSKL